MFNFPTMENAGRLLAFFAGFRDPRYGRDGYGNFLPADTAYDLDRVRRGIYGTDGPRRLEPVKQPVIATAAERQSWNFPTHQLLRDMLSSMSEDTVKVFLFVPYHHFLQSVPGSQAAAYWDECKRRISGMAANVPNAHVLDFMIASELTLSDENYWDVLHYTTTMADLIAEQVAQGIDRRRGNPGFFDYLAPH